MSFGPSYTLYFLGRYPRDVHECYSLGVKDDDHVFLTAGNKWSRDLRKCVCFITQDAADTFLRHLPWKKRERCEVVEIYGSFA